MTNIDRAAGVILAMVKIENPTHDTDVAQALADEGMLMPDDGTETGGDVLE